MSLILIFLVLFRTRFTLLAIPTEKTDQQKCDAEAAWGPWRCPGGEQRCWEPNATRYRCIGGNCTSTSACANLPGFQETKPCKQVLNNGRCVPWWAPWSAWTQCTAICGFMESTRFRACIGAWTVRDAPPAVKAELLQSCAVNTRAAEGVENRECPIRRLCPNINGAWGEWGTFTSCSATCGVGFRRRIRLCNRPSPRGTGLYCQGIDTQQVPCEGPVPCPKRGEWCPWSETIPHCSHPCGPIGMGLRTRLCACPKPSYGGDACEIPPGAGEFAKYEATKRSHQNIPEPSDLAIEAVRTGQGRWEPCNRFPCPYLRFLKEEEEKMVLNDLLAQKPEETWIWSGGVPAKANEPVQLHCPATRQSRVEVFDKPDRFPNSKAYWTKSIPSSAQLPSDMPGKPLEGTKTILIEGDRLTIRSLEPEVTAVYRYGYEYEPGYYETVCFFIVYIKDSVWVAVERCICHFAVEPSMEILHGSTFDLTCKALGLWPVLQKGQMGTWSAYWEVKLDSQLEDSVHLPRWWATELMKQLTEEELKILNQTNNETIRGILTGSGLTLWDTEYRRVYTATESMSGHYTCVLFNMVNETYNRTFYTESFYLKVAPPPTLMQLVKAWCLKNQWHLIVLLIVGLLASAVCALCLWRRSQNIARLEIQTRELVKAKKALNLADLDAKID